MRQFEKLVAEVGEEEAHRRVATCAMSWGKTGMVQFYFKGVPPH